ncbi:hypothetical protein COOONC_08404 [Cooperia oncophora]
MQPPEATMKADILSMEIMCFAAKSRIRFAIVYRPSNSNKDDDESLIEYLTTLLSSGDKMIILEQPTHEDNTLDIILTTSPLVHSITVRPPLSTSDHSTIHFLVDLTCPVTSSIPLADFLQEFQYISASEVYCRFCSIVYRIFGSFVRLRHQRSALLSFPSHIQNLFSKKHRVFYNSENPLNDPYYKKICCDIDHHLKKFWANYERRLASHSSMKYLHVYLRNKMKFSGRPSVLTDNNGYKCYNDSDKAKALGDYFASVFSPENPSNESMLRSFSYTKPGLSDIYFHPYDIYKVLKHLKPSITEPYDGIPPIVFKKCASSLSKPLAHLFNISSLLAEVLWKEALVTGTPKLQVHNRSLNSVQLVSLQLRSKQWKKLSEIRCCLGYTGSKRYRNSITAFCLGVLLQQT